MNLGLWPEAVPFDPDGAGSEELDAYLAGVTFPGAALVVAGQGMRSSLWAPQAAIGLARALAVAGRDVVLVDLDFQAPSLHGLLSESASEGLADVLLFGSSLERVTVLPAGQAFEFVAAGGYAPDAAALLADPGWDRILSGLEARGATFLGYANFDAPGLPDLVARVPSVVILAEPDAVSLTAAFLPDAIRIDALIRPPAPRPPVPDEAAATGLPAAVEPTSAFPEGATGHPPATAPTADSAASTAHRSEAPRAEADAAAEFDRIRLPKDQAREALMADLRARQRTATSRAGAAPVEATLAAAEGQAAPAPDLSEPPLGADRGAGGTGPRPVRRNRAWRWVAGVAVLAAGAAATWYFGVRPADDATSTATVSGPGPAEPVAPPEPVAGPLNWSVAVEAHDRLDAAVRSVDSLAAADTGIGFYIAPATVGGDLWYRVLAGPLGDSAAAVQAMERLVREGRKRAAAVWDVRATPLSFLLGRFPKEPDALVRMSELRQAGVPAYIVEVPYSYGEPWYHIYGGAYGDAPEAERMRQLLLNAGLPDSLVVRVGRTRS